MADTLKNMRAIAQQYLAPTVEFAQHLISVPSMPGHEGEVAQVVRKEMEELAYDEVWTDRVGNVIGKINGGDGPTVMLNGHIDHVDAGPPENWPYPPFEAQIVDGELWGRGSVDMKGPVACMVYAASFIKQLGITPPGDIYVTAAVLEEVGGVGTKHLAQHLQAQAAICGEPSNNTLRRGHRGRVELIVEFRGQSAHASVPHLGVNPHYAAAAFLQALAQIPLAHDDTLGSSTVVPTLYHTDQFSPNVIPSLVQLTLDWRNVPAETPDIIVNKIQKLIETAVTPAANAGEVDVRAAISHSEFTTYTGVVEDFQAVFPSFLLAVDDPLVQAAHAALVEAFGRDDGVNVWRFATDGGHLVEAGIPTVGFGPGDDQLAHTRLERIRLAQMEEALVGYMALALALGRAAA